MADASEIPAGTTGDKVNVVGSGEVVTSSLSVFGLARLFSLYHILLTALGRRHRLPSLRPTDHTFFSADHCSSTPDLNDGEGQPAPARCGGAEARHRCW
jgi:hypothetical protein